jgi:hypothetical protein
MTLDYAVLKELIEAAKPFTWSDAVDGTIGTIPQMDRLKAAIDAARTELRLWQIANDIPVS